jgi:catechol 2,3-dioxygenase-like lactoylglutathione lyase family enzyme
MSMEKRAQIWKKRLVTVFIGGVGGMTLLSAGACFADSKSAENVSSQQRISMSRVSFGNHSAIRVPQNLRQKIRQFYGDVLGCEITKQTDDVDYVRMGDNFFVAFLYDDGALSEPEWLRSIWLEIKADDVLAAKKKILAFGVKEVTSRDKSHLYFQAPGGQVFRLAGTDEDLSKFER